MSMSSFLTAAVPRPVIPTSLSPCGITPGLPCGGGGAAGAASYTIANILPALETAFLAVAIIYFFYYAVRLIIDSEDESVIEETKSAYGYAIAGAVIVSMSGLIVGAVGPGSAKTTLINPDPVISGFSSIVFYFRLMVSAAVSAAITFQGIRMIALQGDEGEISQQKKRFFNGLIGVAIITLANFIVSGFLPSDTSILSVQIVGICNYLLQVFGALCVFAFLAAGFMLVVSTDESLQDRAKKTMFATAISLIVVLSCLVIVNFVVGL